MVRITTTGDIPDPNGTAIAATPAGEIYPVVAGKTGGEMIIARSVPLIPAPVAAYRIG
jgi:hypothetical protein